MPTVEPLHEVAARVAAAVTRWRDRIPEGDLVFVSHQDPVQAGRRLLTGGGLSDFHRAKPGHAAVITLVPGDDPEAPWREVTFWEPDQGVRFPPLEDEAGA
jgi:broad specificity phosphatase PhoE